MKKIMLFTCLSCFTLLSCNSKSDKAVHQHDDGTTHAAHDTAKPVQEVFNVNDSGRISDTTRKDTSHSHKEGVEHNH